MPSMRFFRSARLKPWEILPIILFIRATASYYQSLDLESEHAILVHDESSAVASPCLIHRRE